MATPKVQKALDKAKAAGITNQADLNALEAALIGKSEKEQAKAIKNATKAYKKAKKATGDTSYALDVAKAANNIDKAVQKAIKAVSKSTTVVDGSFLDAVVSVAQSGDKQALKIIKDLVKVVDKQPEAAAEATATLKAVEVLMDSHASTDTLKDLAKVVKAVSKDAAKGNIDPEAGMLALATVALEAKENPSSLSSAKPKDIAKEVVAEVKQNPEQVKDEANTKLEEAGVDTSDTSGGEDNNNQGGTGSDGDDTANDDNQNTGGSSNTGGGSATPAAQNITKTAAEANGKIYTGIDNYTITPSAGAQTIAVKTTGTNTIEAGKGADTITLGVGTGTDKIVVKNGQAGYSASDSVDMSGLAASDSIEVTIGGTGYTFSYDGSVWTDDDNAAAAGFVVVIDSSTASATTVDVSAAASFTLNSVVGAIADDGTTNPATPAGSASDDTATAAGYSASDSVDMSGLAANDSIEVTIGGTGYTFSYDGSVWTDDDNAAAAGFVVVIDSSTTNATTVDVSAVASFTLNSVVGAIADDGSANPATPAGSASDDTATAAVLEVSDSTSSAFDTINNFDLATDKLDFDVTDLLGTSTNANIASVTAGVVAFEAGANDLAAKLTAVFTEFANTKGVAAFVEGSDAYVVVSDGVTGLSDADVVVKLAGIDDLTGVDVASFII